MSQPHLQEGLSASHVAAVLQTICDEGFLAIDDFIVQFLRCARPSIKIQADKFCADGSQRVMDAILNKQDRLKGLDEQAVEDKALANDCTRRMNKDIKKLESVDLLRMKAGSLGPDAIDDFNFQAFDDVYAQNAPFLYQIVRRLCGVHEDQLVSKPGKPNKRKGHSELNCESEDSDEEVEQAESKRTSKRRARRSRNKAIIATVVISLIIFSNKKSNNSFQLFMGMYLSATKTSKRAITVLNQLGLSISYLSICRAWESCADKSTLKLRSRVQMGSPFALMYDNLVLQLKVKEESLTNKNEMLNLTACACFLLDTSGTGIDGRSPLQAIVEEVPDEGSQIGNDGLGIDSKLLLRNTDFSDLDPLMILSFVQTQEYFPKAARGHVMDIFRIYFGDQLDKNPMKLTGIEPKIPTIHKLQAKKTPIFTLPTLDLDESTLIGNIEILEEIAEEVGAPVSRLVGRGVPVAGDQMTTNRIRSAVYQKFRDCPENNLAWVIPWNGWLHVAFAAADALKRCHLGRSDGLEPASLRRFVVLLGRSNLLIPKPDFNALHRFLMAVLDAHVLAVGMVLAGVKTEREFSSWLQKNNYVALVNDVERKIFHLGNVEEWRRTAIEEGKHAGKERYREAVARMHIRTPEDRWRVEEARMQHLESAYIKEEQLKRGDIVHENAVLYMQHGVMYRDFFTAMRAGDTGRLEKELDIFTVFFQGVDKTNYAREMLEQKLDRCYTWTPAMKQLWLQNSLINLAGQENKFMGIDELVEYMNQELKCSYNPNNNWQSREWHMKTLSQSIIPFRSIKRAVYKSSGAPELGERHSSVDQRKDVSEVLGYLIRSEVMYMVGGRHTGEGQNPVVVKPSIDAMKIGRDKLNAGHLLQSVVEGRNRGGRPEEHKMVWLFDEGDVEQLGLGRERLGLLNHGVDEYGDD